MYESTQEDIISLVSSYFPYSSLVTSLTTLQFELGDYEFKSKFVELCQKLENKNLIGRIEKRQEKILLIVSKYPPRKQRRWISKSWTPRLLFGITVIFVLIDGYYRTLGVNSLSMIGDPVGVAVLYAWALIGILGVHEAGHLLAARMHKIKTTWPYFIPGIPVFGIPTFGALIQSRSLTINKDILFDIAVAGPIAGLVIAVIVSLFGAYTSPVIDNVTAQSLYQSSQVMDINDNIIMIATLELFDKNGDDIHVIMSPIMFAAWIGFLITFLNLLPAWQLDGGHMSRVILGQKWHRIATYGSMGILVLLGYWMMAMLILVMSSRAPDAKPLDDVSPLSNNRKIIYIIVIILAFLCAPIPSSIIPF